MSRTPAEPEYTRTALVPGLLAAIVLLAGLALIGNDWFIGVRFVVSILALIMCVFAGQGKQYWWYLGLIPVAVVWNPVWPITGIDDIPWRLMQLGGALICLAAGFLITVPTERNTGHPRIGRTRRG